MRISVIADTESVNAKYRVMLPMEVLAQRGHLVEYGSRVRLPSRRASAAPPDVVFIHRSVAPETRALAEWLAADGVGIVWDNDDDIGAIPKGSPLYAKFGGAKLQAVARGVTGMARLAHVVTTPSHSLAAKYRASGAQEVRVLENYLPAHFAGVKRGKHDGIVIVWVAALEHQVDYQRLRLQETLQRLLDANGDVQVLSIGLRLGLQSDRYRHMRGVDHENLARGLATCDIGIAPLADIPWNRARSNVKLKEYGIAGLAWLASPVLPYASLGEREGGRLVPDDAWYPELERLVRQDRVRRKLSKHAQKWARSQTLDRHAERWLSACETAAERANVSRS